MRIPKWLRWLTLLILLCALLLSAAIYGTRRGEGFCLLLDRDEHKTYIDPRSGSSVIITIPKILADNLSFVPGRMSPNGDYIGYIMSEESDFPKTSLLLIPLRDGPHAQSILIANNIPSQADDIGISWSPDSRQFAYKWQDANKRGGATIVWPNGSKQSITFEVGDDVQGYGWSTDSAYYAFGVRHGSETTRTLYYWSSATRQFINGSAQLQILHDKELFPAYEYELVEWSPHGHKIAFLSLRESGSVRLAITTPTGNDSHIFNFASDLKDPRFSWSPNGSYLALSSQRILLAGRTWTVDAFDANGGTYREISKLVPDQPNDAVVPQMIWSREGDHLLYMERASEKALANDLLGRLMAFDTASKQPRIIADGVDINYLYKPSKRFIQIRWWQNEKPMDSVVDRVSGRRYELKSESSVYVHFSPDERFVVIDEHSGRVPTYKLMPLDASWQVDLPTREDDMLFLWSPDSTIVLFMSSSWSEISAYGMDGTLRYKVPFADAGYYQTPRWLPCSEIP